MIVVMQNNVVMFLHGFLGTSEDWIPIMQAISGCARCIAVDLPGHGRSKIQNLTSNGPTEEPCLSVEIVADIIYQLLCSITPGKVTLVGYSMGARIALYMALRCSDKVTVDTLDVYLSMVGQGVTEFFMYFST